MLLNVFWNQKVSFDVFEIIDAGNNFEKFILGVWSFQRFDNVVTSVNLVVIEKDLPG